MIRRTLRGIVQLVGGLGAGFAIIVMLIAWQFSRGPIPLGFLSPYIEAAVNTEDRQFTLRMGETILTWAGWERALDIRVLDVRVIGQSGTTIGSIPEVSFSISGEALLSGRLAPKSIELYGPKLRLRRDSDGKIDVGFDGQGIDKATSAEGLLGQLISPTRSDQSTTFLERIAIIGGDVTVDDQVLDKSWHMPAADVRLIRYIDRLAGEMSLVLDGAERQAEFDVAGEYVMASKRLNLSFKFKDIEPALFAALAQDLAPLEPINMPLSGTVSLGMPIDGDIDVVNVAVEASAGELELPQPMRQTVEVSSVKLRAGFNSSNQRIDIKQFDVSLAKGTSIQLPKPINHRMPVRSISLQGVLENDGRDLVVKRFSADLDGAAVEASGRVSGIGDEAKSKDVEVSGSLSKVPVDDVKRYWPATLGSDAYDWVTTHLSKGMMPKAVAKGHFRIHPDMSMEVVKLDGSMSVTGTEVDYLAPLPPVRGTEARMEFDKQSYTIHVDAGRSMGLSVRGGKIRFTGLDQYDQFADIDLEISGKLPAQLAYIDREPLGFSSLLGIDPKQAKGDGTTRLRLFFIAEKSLTWDQVQVWARSHLSDVTLGNVFLGRDIRNGELELRVDKRGMDVSGNVVIDKIPAVLHWRENFLGNADFKSQYRINAKISDVGHVGDLGIDFKPFSGDFVNGEVGAQVEYTVIDDVDRRLEVDFDLSQAELSLPTLGWSKPKGDKGEAHVTVNLARDLVVDIPQFSIAAADLRTSGAAKYALDGTGLERIDFSRIAYGRTDMKGALIPRSDGGWEAGFHGRSFDLSPFWADIKSDVGDADDAADSLLDNLTLAAEFEEVWLEDSVSIRNVSGTFARNDDLWQRVLLKAQVEDDADLNIDIGPDATGRRALSLRSKNAGKILKFLDLYPNMVGGELHISGVYDDAAPGQPLKGRIDVRDYRISNAPTLAHVLSIMALTGILDALQGDGLAFSTLEVPFELNQGTLRMTNARASGTSLGFTASGKIFRHADVVELEGTVVPAYALNSAFGHIPLLGDILTGGEKGGGVFAAKFNMTGPVEEPTVSVNPLSALTPGFLRNVFGIFGNAGSEEPSPSPEPPQATQ